MNAENETLKPARTRNRPTTDEHIAKLKLANDALEHQLKIVRYLSIALPVAFLCGIIVGHFI